jgi:hypothetical protein
MAVIMRVAGLCDICGKSSVEFHQCPRCHRMACMECSDALTRLCELCQTGKRASRTTPDKELFVPDSAKPVNVKPDDVKLL